MDFAIRTSVGTQPLRILALAQGTARQQKFCDANGSYTKKKCIQAKYAPVYDEQDCRRARTRMRASIKDELAIGAIRPLNVVGYLRAHGWQRFSGSPEGRFSVWHNLLHPDAEILIPVDRDARDYVLLLRDVLEELEAVENRSQLEILRDLYNSGFDVV